MGKAAPAMARAAVAVLREHGSEPAGGIVIAAESTERPHPGIDVAIGDHPLPGPGSLAAAGRLGECAERVSPPDEVWVLLSGGATSLVAAPIAGVGAGDLAALYTAMFESGLDIASVNKVRKRFSRWSGGRLAVALWPARIRCLVISDVIGDDIAAIGSGPCVPDPTTLAEVRDIIVSNGLLDRTPPAIVRALALLPGGAVTASVETPKVGHRAFDAVETRVIASNRLALDAAAAQAARRGLRTRIVSAELAGDAAVAGDRIARELLRERESAGWKAGPRGQPAPPVTCLVWGGETTVTLPGLHGRGGRCQELALAAARVLSAAGGAAESASLLAAGTDGRDGPTDAAGAVVDARTWSLIQAHGRDPARDLAAHDSHPALDAAGALLRTGPTGTNVMDVVFGLCGGADIESTPPAHVTSRIP